MNNRIKKLMGIARKLSYKSQFKYKIGCVIANGGTVLGLGFNNPRKMHPKSNSQFKNIHAELSAILNSRKEDLTDCTAYIYRELKEGGPAIAKPCAYCQELLKQMGVKNIIYTDSEKGMIEETL